MKQYYIYRHIRHDKDEPFYIGKGIVNPSGKRLETKFRRAFETVRRNTLWQRVAKKTSYSVEILFITEDVSQAYSKEDEFIALYGMKTQGGKLANLMLGPYNPNENASLFNSDILRKQWSEGKRKALNARKTYCYDLQGNLLHTTDSRKKMAEILGEIYITLRDRMNVIRGHNYYLSYDEMTQPEALAVIQQKQLESKELKERTLAKQIESGKKVGARIKYENIQQCNDAGEIVKTWSDTRAIEKELGLASENICHSIKEKHKSGGFYWRLT